MCTCCLSYSPTAPESYHWGILLRNIFSKTIQAVHCITGVYQSWHRFFPTTPSPSLSLQRTQFCSFLWLSNIPLYIVNANLFTNSTFLPYYLNDFLKFHFSNLFYKHSFMNVHSYEHGRASCWVLLAIIGWFFSQVLSHLAAFFPSLSFCLLSPLLISGVLFTFC